MRVRNLGRWAVRLVAIAAFGVGAVATAAVVSAEDEPTPSPEFSTTVNDKPERPNVVAPNSTSWE